MTSPVADRASLARRLDRYRATTNGGAGAPLEAARQVELPHAPVDRGVLAERLARTVGGEVVAMAGGLVVRCTTEPREIPLDRAGLAGLPGQPPPEVPLVCLDTETTGLATATGTVAFLVGLGWWEGECLPPGPAAAPRSCRRTRTAHRPGRVHPARRLAGDLQRPGLRLATARHPLPHGPPGRPAPRRPPRPAAGRPPIVPSPARGRSSAHGGNGSARDGPPRRHRRLGDPRTLSRFPARRAGRATCRGRPPQRPGRPLARASPRPARQRLRDSRGATDGAGRRPRRSGPCLRSGGTTQRSPRVLRRRLRDRASAGAGSRSAADPAAPARPATPARTHRRGPVVVATGPGGLRRLAAAARRVRAVGSLGGLRHSLDDRPDRGRARPSAAPPAALGRRCGCVGEPGRRSGPDGDRRRRSSSPSSASTACAIRSGRCARPATASRSPSGGSVSGVRSRGWRRTCAPARDGCDGVWSGGPRRQPGGPTRGRRGSGSSRDQRDRTWSSAGSNEQAIVRRSPASALR